MSKAAVEALESAHRALAKDCGKDAVHALRTGAMDRFRELGFPTTKDEEWRFTNVAPVAEAATLPLARPGGDGVKPDDVSRLAMDGAHGARLVFVDGHLRTDLSTAGEMPAGVVLRGLAEALAEGEGPWSPHLARHAVQEDRPFVSLNTAFLEDGALLHIGRGVAVEEPIHLLYVATEKISFPRNLIVLEDGAAASVVETYASLGGTAHLSVVVSETVLGKNAELDHYRIQAENDRALHVSHCQVHQDRDSRYRSHGVTIGGRLTRNDIDAVLDEENITCTLNGLFLTRGTQHVDNHTRLLHKKPHCDSHELYKGILDDESTGVFSGKIHVFEDAQKTDAKQSSANLLLSDDAVIDAKPQLEIYADDVKCTHGTTIGQLDDNALFYLRARGIPAAQARNILIRAFAGDITNRIRLEGVRERVDALLAERLPGG